MINKEYYRQRPIMERIFEFTDDAVYVAGSTPSMELPKKHRRYPDIAWAAGEGVDLFRSLMDFKRLLFVIDVEYGNSKYPGEIFHRPKETFEKIEPMRKSIKGFLDSHGISHIELMTGQGYNFISSMSKNSSSYGALEKLGSKLRVLPWTSVKMLLEKEREYSNFPLVRDALVFGALGRLTDFVFKETSKGKKDFPIKSSDIFDKEEIIIFDTTQYGDLMNRRGIRSAFSLHQKSKMNPAYNYGGPPLATIPSKGLSLDELIETRSDERWNYKKALNLAKKTDLNIPTSDFSSLITSYVVSDSYEKDLKNSRELGIYNPGLGASDWVLEEIKEKNLPLNEESILWDLRGDPTIDKKITSNLSQGVQQTLNNPNELMLRPTNLQNLIRELQSKKVPNKQIIELISRKYREDHNWGPHVFKNDSLLRAEYWVRTLGNI